MRRFQIDGSGPAAIKSGFPSRDANAPTVSRFESGKTPFGHRRHEIVPVEDREIEKFLSYFDANGVLTNVIRTSPAISVPIKSSHRVATTTAEFGPKNVRQHDGIVALRASS
jgi:hypothetical protein